MGSIWKTNYLQMAANFQESAKKTNQEYQLNDLLQWGILWSSWGLPTAVENPPLPSSHPPSATSASDLRSYFTEEIRTDKGQPARLTLPPCLVFICFYASQCPSLPPRRDYSAACQADPATWVPAASRFLLPQLLLLHLQFPHCLFFGSFLSACVSNRVSST